MKSKIHDTSASELVKQFQHKKFYNMSKKLLLLLLALFVMISCETGDPNPTTTHIFAVGNTTANDGNIEGYISRDGVSTSLGTGYLVIDVFVNGNDVYTCGQKDNKPAYTLNGVLTLLESTTLNYAYKIFVKNNDVYVVGGKDDHPVYWKNGVVNVLDTATDFKGVAYDIIISNNDIYIAGYQYQIGNPFVDVLYWKNGNRTTVNTAHHFSASFLGEISIAVDNNDVYLAVNERNDTGVFNSNAYLVKNGTEETLIDDNSEVHDIVISNSDIYLCGNHIDSSGVPNKSIVWKNGVVVVEKDVEHGTFIDLTVSNNNIFAVGIESNLVSPDPLPFGTHENHATTLINNVFAITPDFGNPVGGSGYLSVFVTE
jgi:hypothetical protein